MAVSGSPCSTWWPPVSPIAEALATATSGAAESCGLADVTGRLAPGLAADLLVVNGDLTAEPDALLRPDAVFVRGERTL